MASIEERLAGYGFLRVHRSAIVNLEKVVELRPFEAGDGEVTLTSAQRMLVSRRHRRRLRDVLQGG